MNEGRNGSRQLSLGESFKRARVLSNDNPEAEHATIESLAEESGSEQSHSPCRQGSLALDVASFERTWPRPRTTCRACSGALVLRWGEQRRPHFAHLSSSTVATGCSGGESMMHSLAKALLARHLNARRRLRLCYSCPRCTRMSDYNLDMASLPDAGAREEHTLITGARVDLCVVVPDQPPIVALEILHTHRTSGTGRADLPWFEVRAEDVVTALGNNINVNFIELACRRQDRAPCGHAMCIATREIADRLGYRHVYNPYSSDNDREKDAAIRGKYKLPLQIWETRPDDEEVDEEEDNLWREFLRRRHCIRCLGGYDARRRRPLCLRCFKLTSRENDEPDDDRCDWQEISGDDKMHLRAKFRWLFRFSESAPGDTCQMCGSHGYTWWFGKRKLCHECFAAWTLSDTQRYLEKVGVQTCDGSRRKAQNILQGF